jgi:succinoglycan biosynthesis transport protein ExoP
MHDGIVRTGQQSSIVANGLENESFAAGFSPPPKNPWERPLAAIRRYKWLLVGIVIISTAVGFVGTQFITPSYEVRATLWIASEAGTSDRGPIRSAELLNSQAWIELFRSFRIVDQVVRELSLYLQPADPADAPLFAGFTLADRYLAGDYELQIDRPRKAWTLRNTAGVVISRGSAGDSVGANIGFRWRLPGTAFEGSDEKRVGFRVATPRETSSSVLRRLESRSMGGSNFLGLTYRDTDPQLAARTLNTWLGEYVRVAVDLKRRNVTEFANILEGQLRYAERATQEAETAYQRFRVNTITLPTDAVPIAAGAQGGLGTGDPAISSFFEQKIAYDDLRQDREALERSIANAANGSAPYEGLLLIPSVSQSPAAQGLRDAFTSLYAMRAKLNVERQTFTDEYPTVKELKANLDVLHNRTIPELAIQLLARLRDREADYQRRIAGASRELQEIPPRTIEEMRLKRAVTVAEALYTNLKGRYAEAQLAEASATPDVSLLDTAIAPLSPVKNTAPAIVLMAIGGGLAAAIALALLLDGMDRRIRYTEHVTTELGLGIAGTIPRAPKNGSDVSAPERVVQFVESFRSLRMHVMHSIPGHQLTLAVTSAAPGDGKSLVSANLALSFAEAGLRTVLVDGDTRRGTLHRMFGMKVTGGLTDFLDGGFRTEEVVRLTPHANLSFVSSGRRDSRSPELLVSPKLKLLVKELSETFDVVIFDTPPLAAGIDGFAISAAAGSILMVLRMDKTERRLVNAKLAVLDRLPVNIMGAVLNGVSLTGEFEYYGYAAGYSVESSEASGNMILAGTK